MSFFILDGEDGLDVFVENGNTYTPVSLEAVEEEVVSVRVTGITSKIELAYTPIPKSSFADKKIESASAEEIIKRLGLGGDTKYTFNTIFVDGIQDLTATKPIETVNVTTNPTSAVVTAASDDTDIATVTVTDKEVAITCVAPGTATITVTATKTGFETTKREFEFTVSESILVAPIADIETDELTAEVTVVAFPSDVGITAESSDELIATVAVVGKIITVTKVGAGSAEISYTATKEDFTSVTAVFNVTFE